jgi:hypothetical protein
MILSIAFVDIGEHVCVDVGYCAAYSITPVMSDGTNGPSLELRGLFEQFHTEAR